MSVDPVFALLIANLLVSAGVGLSHLVDKLSFSGVKTLHVGVCSQCFQLDISRSTPSRTPTDVSNDTRVDGGTLAQM